MADNNSHLNSTWSAHNLNAAANPPNHYAGGSAPFSLQNNQSGNTTSRRPQQQQSLPPLVPLAPFPLPFPTSAPPPPTAVGVVHNANYGHQPLTTPIQRQSSLNSASFHQYNNNNNNNNNNNPLQQRRSNNNMSSSDFDSIRSPVEVPIAVSSSMGVSTPPPPSSSSAPTAHHHHQRQKAIVLRSGAFLLMLATLLLLGTLRARWEEGESESQKKAAAGSTPTDGSSSSANGEEKGGSGKERKVKGLSTLLHDLQHGKKEHKTWWEADEVPFNSSEEIIDRWADRRRRDVDALIEKEDGEGEANGNAAHRIEKLLFRQSWENATQSSSSSPIVGAISTKRLLEMVPQTTVTKAQEQQLRQFMLQQIKASEPWRRRHWRDYEVYRPIGFGNADDDISAGRKSPSSSSATSGAPSPPKRKLPWKKVFIAANVFNNEDIMGDYLASMTAFIERGLLGRKKSRLDGAVGEEGGGEEEQLHRGDWFKPEDVFVSVYSNANSDSTPYLLEHLAHPQLAKIGVRHHIVPQGAPTCSGLRFGNVATGQGISTMEMKGAGGDDAGEAGSPNQIDRSSDRYGLRFYDRTRKKPKSVSRIEWLGCLRNHALLPLLVHGREGLYGNGTAGTATVADAASAAGKRKAAASSASFFDGLASGDDLHPAFLKWYAEKEKQAAAQKKKGAAKVDIVSERHRIPAMMAPTSTASSAASPHLVDYDGFIHDWFRDTYTRPESERFRQRWGGSESSSAIQQQMHNGDATAAAAAQCNHSFGLTGYFQQPYQNWWDPHSFVFKQNRLRYAQETTAMGSSTNSAVCQKGANTAMDAAAEEAAGRGDGAVPPMHRVGVRAKRRASTSRRAMLSVPMDEGAPSPSSSSSPPSHEHDDDVLVLFFNDVYFYPWQISYLMATNTGIAPPSAEKKTEQQSSAVVPPAATASNAPSFDMACALDYYNNLYDTWVLRGLGGQPFTPFAPYAPVEHAVSPITDIRPILEHHRGAGKGPSAAADAEGDSGDALRAPAMLTGPTLLSDVLGFDGYYSKLKNALSYIKKDAHKQTPSSTASDPQHPIAAASGGPKVSPVHDEHARGRVQEVLGTMTNWVVKGDHQGQPVQDGDRQLVLPALPVRSCWNGVVAIRGGLFLREGLRFRFQTKEELLYQQCWESECKYIGQDMATIAMIKAMEEEEEEEEEQGEEGRQFNSGEEAARSASSLPRSLSDESFILSPSRVVVNPLVQISYDKDFFSLYQGEEPSPVEEALGELGRRGGKAKVADTFGWARGFTYKKPPLLAEKGDDESASPAEAAERAIRRKESFDFTGDTANAESGTFSYTVIDYVPSTNTAHEVPAATSDGAAHQPPSSGKFYNFISTPIRRLVAHFIPSGLYYTLQYWVKVGSWWAGLAVPKAPQNPYYREAALGSNNNKPAVAAISAPPPSATTTEILSLLLQVAIKLQEHNGGRHQLQHHNHHTASHLPSHNNGTASSGGRSQRLVAGLSPREQAPIPSALEKFLVMEDPIVTGGALRPAADPLDEALLPYITAEDHALYRALFGAASQSAFIGQWWWHQLVKAKEWLAEVDEQAKKGGGGGSHGNPSPLEAARNPLLYASESGGGGFISLLRRANLQDAAERLVAANNNNKKDSAAAPLQQKGDAITTFQRHFFAAVRVIMTLKRQYGYDLEQVLVDALAVNNPPPKDLRILARSLRGGDSPIASVLDPRFMFCLEATDTLNISVVMAYCLDLACVALVVALFVLLRRHAREHHYDGRQLAAAAKATAHQLQDAVMHPSHLMSGAGTNDAHQMDSTSSMMAGGFGLNMPTTPVGPSPTSNNGGRGAFPKAGGPTAEHFQRALSAGLAASKELLTTFPAVMCVRPMAVRLSSAAGQQRSASADSGAVAGGMGRLLDAMRVATRTRKDDAKMV